MHRKAVLKAMEDIAYDGPRRRGNNADHARQIGQKLLAGRIEQAFGGEFLLALLKKRHECSKARRFDGLNDDLIARLAGKGRQSPRDHNLKALLRLDREARCHTLPNDA